MAFTRETAYELLCRSAEGGRLAHAYLVSGPDPGELRALVAQLVGVVTGAGATLDHPDIHVAEPESKSRKIRIEQTRALERELQMRSLLGGRKIAVLFDADRLTNEAANAFLKTLEEPPENSLLILTSTAPEILPNTIISRCITLPIAPGAAARALTASQARLVEALRPFTEPKPPGIAGVFGLVQVLLGLLREVRDRLTEENAGALKAEEKQYRQTTESGHWLDEREDFYKALTESRYILQRFELVDTLLQWWGDVLRQQSGFARLDLPACAPDTGQMATRLEIAEALRRTGSIEELRENLNRTGVQEQLAIEVGLLKAFG
jgi:DNA polymerase-3 subunit delta'